MFQEETGSFVTESAVCLKWNCKRLEAKLNVIINSPGQHA